MMQTNLPFLNVDSADSTLQRLRIRLLQFILSFLALTAFMFVVSLFASGSNLLSGGSIIPPVATIISLVLLMVVSRGRLINITSIIVISYIILIAVYLFALTDDTTLLFVTLSLAGLTIALLLSRFNFWAFSILLLFIAVGVTILSTVQETGLTPASFNSFLLTIAFGLIPITISTVTRLFVFELERTANRVQRSVSLLAANADIGRSISDTQNLDLLLHRSVEVIRDRFAFYHVSIFLTDENNQYTHLTASTGDIGERMLARGHRLPIDTNSVVGRTTQAQDVIVIHDADEAEGHSYNELLPDTRSELAIPIIDTQGTIGVIDIQSHRPNAFTATEIDALRVISNQLATAIRNARLFEDKENSIRENKRLFIEAETNLREIQRLNRQLTKQAWTDYLQTDRRIDGVTLGHEGFQNRANWSEEMVTASQKRRAVTEDKDGIRKIAVPIELRGEVVGAIELETQQDKNKDDVVDMIRSVSQRLGVSLDNARLFEESNEATAQEQRISEIVSRYQSADSVNELLRLTIKGLAETLGAEQASIRLGVVPDISTVLDDDPSPNANGVSIE